LAGGISDAMRVHCASLKSDGYACLFIPPSLQPLKLLYTQALRSRSKSTASSRGRAAFGAGQRGGETAKAAPTDFYGSVALDPLRLGSSAGQVATEVLQHLSALPGAEVTVTLEIRASVTEGVPSHIVRTVTENARTLSFKTAEFED